MSKLVSLLALLFLISCNDSDEFSASPIKGLDGEDGTVLELVQEEDRVVITSSDQEDEEFEILNGRDGLDGQDGLNGRDGLDGAQGPQGVAGKDGATGAQGPQGVAGRNGTNGTNGKDGINGQDGQDGTNGENGKDGQDGESCTIKSVDGGAVITCANGVEVALRNGKDGENGDDGINGQDGTNGQDGQDGINGQDGEDGQDGLNGRDGIDGIDGQDGQDGKDGVKLLGSVVVPGEGCTMVAQGIYVQTHGFGEPFDVYFNAHCLDREGEHCDNVLPSFGVSGVFDAGTHPGSGTLCWAYNDSSNDIKVTGQRINDHGDLRIRLEDWDHR